MKIVTNNSHNKDTVKYCNIVYRSRGLIINSNNEILLGKMDNTYQFPGGHANENETLQQCLVREIKEETGIEVMDEKLEPFYIIKNYEENIDENSYSEFYYYLINTDDKYDISKTNYDEYEINYNYRLEYMNIEDLIKILSRDVNLNSINKLVYPDMLDVLNEYLKNKM